MVEGLTGGKAGRYAARREGAARAPGKGGRRGWGKEKILSVGTFIVSASTAGAERTGSVQRHTGTVYGRAGGTKESGLGGTANTGMVLLDGRGRRDWGLADGGGEVATITE